MFFAVAVGALFAFAAAIHAPSTVHETVKVTLGTQVNLTCHIPAASQLVLTWKLYYTTDLFVISVCAAERECTYPKPGIFSPDEYPSTRAGNLSALYVTNNDVDEFLYQCVLGENVTQSYFVKFIDTPEISLNCSVAVSVYQHYNISLRYSCGASVSDDLDYDLTISGSAKKVSKIGHSVQYVNTTIEKITDVGKHYITCTLSLIELDITEKCVFPGHVSVTHETRGMDAAFDCDTDLDDAVTWRLLDPQGREEDITGRAWTRNEGRSLLIRNIGKEDLGKVAECQTNDSLGFGVIDEIGSSGNGLDYNGGTGPNVGHSDRSVYVTLTYVFGGLLLLILLIVISYWRCGACEQPMKWCAQFKPHGKPKTSTTNQLSGSTSLAFSGGGSNKRRPGLQVDTVAESNPDSGNQNNSALSHPRDPTPQMKATSSSDAGASSGVHLDQPVVDTNQHTYFCVERTTPPPSLPDLSTSGSVTIYQDPDYEESHGERLRDSAGYDVVDASKKKMNHNFDMDDYAEVGGAYDMTSNPAIAPRSSKGWTGKGVVMSSDPAVLYGKVNK